MSEAKLPDNVSTALARFADVLCMYDIDVFSPQLKDLLTGPASRLDERTIMFRLAEHAVHVSAVELLEARDRKADADRLRSLAPITDQATARAARVATGHDRRQSLVGHAHSKGVVPPPAMRMTEARPLALPSTPPTPSQRPRAATPMRRPLEKSTTRPSTLLAAPRTGPRVRSSRY